MAYSGRDYTRDIERIRQCERCNLYLSRDAVVIYRGTPGADIMIVGEAPTARDEKEGTALNGPAWEYFADLLHKNGIHPQQCYYTTVALCKPYYTEIPLVEHMDACSKWLNYQIVLINPRWIIAVGRIAYSRLNPRAFRLNRDRITQFEGTVDKPPHLEGIPVTAVQHPSVVLTTPVKASSYERAISDICGMIQEDLHTEM